MLRAKVDYLHLQKREQEVLELQEINKHIPDFREMLVDRAIENTHYDTAKKLCREGITIAEENNYPGTVSH